MAGLSNAYEIKVLDVLFGKATLTSPNVWAYLAHGAISDDDTGATISDNGVVVSAGVGFLPTAANGSCWSSAAGGSIANITTIVFTSSTGSWGTLTHVFLADSSTLTTGVVISYCSLTSALAVASDTIVQFAVGAISCILS